MRTAAALLLGCLLWCANPTKSNAHGTYVTYYAPPVVYTSCYAPPAVAYQPVARYRTRYRPFLGGTVTRVRYGYAPVYTYPAPLVVAY